MSKLVFDFVGGDEEKHKRIEAAMRKELAKLLSGTPYAGTDPYRTPEQRKREAEIDREIEDQYEEEA